MTRDEFVADKIRQFIQEGYFEPGQKLDQSEIAQLLNVSRSPVREALRTLAAEGLVNVFPHRGALVASLSLEELKEVFLMRGALEGLAARLGVAETDDERVAQLQLILEKLNNCHDFGEWLKLNQSFHHTLYKATHTPRLLATIRQLRNIATPYIRKYITTSEHRQAARRGHEQIMEACLQRDPLLAQEATQRHIEEVCDSALAYVASQQASSNAEV